MKRISNFFTTLAGFAALVFFAACATSIPVRVERPPNLDVSGITRVAVMPFETASNENIYRQTAQHAANTASAKIQGLNRFVMVNPREIERLRRSGENIENYVDALFGGQITRVSVNQDTSKSQYTKDGKTYTVITYSTQVELEFNYFFTRARDKSLIGPVNKKSSKSETSQDGYPSASALCAAIVDEQFKNLYRDIVPHTITQQRTLAKEKSDNKELKAQMKETLALVKNGDYNAALDSYRSIYDQYQSVAAAENAAILYEALGNTTAALDFMRRVAGETGSPAARAALARLNTVLQDQAAAAAAGEKLAAPQDGTARAAAYASGEIRKVLPANAKVWIVNISARNATAAAIADNLTADFIRREIPTVDRQSRYLIEAEQKFQMSGSVADSDFVSIGNAAGANIIITVGVSGTGAVRRLQVRVVDIERGVPLMQSDTGSGWQL